MKIITKSNLVNFMFSYQIGDAFQKWAENQNKSFIYCWKEVLREQPIQQFDTNGDTINIPPREQLQLAVKSLLSSISAQIFCYAYEILLNNYEPSLCTDKTKLDQLKNKILVAPKNFNNEQLLKFIRNAISHNNDVNNTPSYYYDKIKEVFSFLPTKKNQNGNSTQITISQKELFDLITIYAKNQLDTEQHRFLINFDMNKIHSNTLISKIVNSIRMKRLSSNTLIYPDTNQKRVLHQLIENIRCGNIKDDENLSLYFPFKQSCKINYIKFINFYTLIENLYNLRDLDFENYLSEVEQHSPTNLDELKNFNDIENLFIINRLFIIFSSTPNSIITSELNKDFEHIKLRRLRNSIMHGTFFFDLKKEHLYVYDAPRSSKIEEKLEFIDDFSCEELLLIFKTFVNAKSKDIINSTLNDITT